MAETNGLKHENSDKEEDVKDEKKRVEAEDLKNKANNLFKGMLITLSLDLCHISISHHQLQ